MMNVIDLNAKLEKLLALILDNRQDCKKESHVEYLVQNGLVMDGIHANRVIKSYYKPDPTSIDSFVSTSSDDHMIQPTDFVDIEESARKCMRDLFPGMQGTNQDAQVLKTGCRFILSASGNWVSRRGSHAPLYNVPAGMLRGLNLGVSGKTSREHAKCFTVVQIKGSKEMQCPIHYGQLVKIVSGCTARWIRFICPGKFGVVKYGDTFFISDVKNKATWVLSSVERPGGVVPIWESNAKYPSTQNAIALTMHPLDNELMPSYNEEQDEEEEKGDMNVSVVVYNAWMMPSFWGIVDILNRLGRGIAVNKKIRSREIPQALLRALTDASVNKLPDVIVLCEAFDSKALNTLKSGLKRVMGMAFESTVVGSGPIFKTRALCSGGVVVMSRYPILSTQFITFDKSYEWAGGDGFANKGAVICRILKNNRPFFVVGTHLQAWDSEKAMRCREAQLLKIRRTLHTLKIPMTEPVLIAGDLNVDRILFPAQYKRMLDILGAKDTNNINNDDLYKARLSVARHLQSNLHLDEATALGEESKHYDELGDFDSNDESVHGVFSFNIIFNTLAMGGPSAGICCQLLDYVLYSQNHLLPKQSSHKILNQMKGSVPHFYKGTRHDDLSDHYPVYSSMTFRM